ncbi:MAG: DUF6331 family protein [Pseudomonadota bacterium]
MLLPELFPEPHLANLLADCEVNCVHDCCGIDAFDITPLHVAAHLTKYSGKIQAHKVQVVLDEIETLLSSAVLLTEDENGFVCSVAKTNQLFSKKSLGDLMTRVSWAVRVAPILLMHNEELVKSYEMENHAKGTYPGEPC